jgi:hypothetical protein
MLYADVSPQAYDVLLKEIQQSVQIVTGIGD